MMTGQIDSVHLSYLSEWIHLAPLMCIIKIILVLHYTLKDRCLAQTANTQDWIQTSHSVSEKPVPNKCCVVELGTCCVCLEEENERLQLHADSEGYELHWKLLYVGFSSSRGPRSEKRVLFVQMVNVGLHVVALRTLTAYEEYKQ